MDTERSVIPLLFVLTGTFNVLLAKWCDILQGKGSDGELRPFQHPMVQTMLMFFGEFLCFVLYKIIFFFLNRRGDGSENQNMLTKGGREFSPLTFLFPAFLDTIASILLFTGLYLTYVSSFQMIRGSAIIFVGIFSSMYLNQTLTARHWMAIFTISCSVVVILSIDVQRVYYDKKSLSHVDANAILTGNLMILCAQIFHAAQFVYEEKRLKGLDVPPLQAVGWQGIFGLIISAFWSLCFNYLPMQVPFADNSRQVFDDLGDLFAQLHSNFWLPIVLSLFVLSCALYNFSALTIVKFSSTANRILADGLRIIFVWVIAVLLEWEYVNLLTVSAYIILLMGTISYRNAIFLEWYRSLIGRILRNRYSHLNVEQGVDSSGAVVPTIRPADAI